MALETIDRWLDAQYSVLGAILLDGDLIRQAAMELTEEHFEGACKTVFSAMRSLFADGVAVDPVTVCSIIGDQYAGFLRELMQIVPTTANFPAYIEIAKNQAAISAMRDIAQELSSCTDMDKAQTLVSKLQAAAAGRQTAKAVNMADSFRGFLARQKEKPQYLDFPMVALNRHLFVEAGDYVIVGGEPSTGKTAFTLQLAAHFATGKKVGYYSLETSESKITDRAMALIYGVSMTAIKERRLTEADWHRITAGHQQYISKTMDIIPAAGWSADEIRAHTLLRGYDVIVIDYLQLLRAHGVSRTEQVTGISIALHTLAQSTGTVVIALSQLSRAEKGRSAVREMSDLRESGQIEQDADVIMLLSLAEKDKPNGDRNLRIAKNKDGLRGTIRLSFDGGKQRFAEVIEETPEVKELKRSLAEKEKSKRNDMEQLPMDTPVPF